MMKAGAELKVDRAAQLVAGLRRLLRTRPPFSYVVDTDWKARLRYIQSRRDDEIASEVALICGDAVHNLRAALDQAFWDRVSPFAKTEKARRDVQFPICQRLEDLQGRLQRTSATEVSPAFCEAITNLKPFREEGGNQHLCFIHDLDVTDKHKLLIPIGEHKAISIATLRKEIRDFPLDYNISVGAIGQSTRDFQWPLHPKAIGIAVADGARRLNVSVEAHIAIPDGINRPIIEVLDQLVETARKAVAVMLAT